MPSADVSVSAQSEPEPEPDSSEAFVEATPAGPCAPSNLDVCTEVCGSRECLDWCAGSGCVAVVTKLHGCAKPAELAYDAAYPEPELETVPPGPDAPEHVYPELDPASEERLMHWEIEREVALGEHWEASCQTACESSFAEADPDEVAATCEVASMAVYGWDAFARTPKSERDRMIAENSRLLGVMAMDGSLLASAGLLGGSYLTVDHDALADFEHASALSGLITRASSMHDAQACVANLDDDGEEFAFVVEFDGQGLPKRTRAESSGSASECVAALLDEQLRIPAPAARDLPAIRLTVHVRESSYDDVWGGLSEAAIDEAYGIGGLGLTGTGQGGGGTGEGIGGIGTIGSGGGGGGSGYGAGSAGSSGSADQDEDSDEP